MFDTQLCREQRAASLIAWLGDDFEALLPLYTFAVSTVFVCSAFRCSGKENIDLSREACASAPCLAHRMSECALCLQGVIAFDEAHKAKNAKGGIPTLCS